MNQKFLMVLFSTILYNGVTYSYPASEQISDVKGPEEKLPATPSVVISNNKKLETAITTVNHSIPITQRVINTPQHSQVSTTISSTVSSESGGKNTIVNSSAAEVKNSIQDPVSENTSPVIDNKKSNETAGYINPNASASANVSENVPAAKNSTASSAVTPVEKHTTAPSSSVSAISTITTSVETTTKSIVITASPTEILRNNVAEHNTPAPVEEKHFDGPSFIGGIVLTIGLTAIGFIAFKYYKSGKIDMNYRTL